MEYIIAVLSYLVVCGIFRVTKKVDEQLAGLFISILTLVSFITIAYLAR